MSPTVEYTFNGFSASHPTSSADEKRYYRSLGTKNRIDIKVPGIVEKKSPNVKSFKQGVIYLG